MEMSQDKPDLTTKVKHPGHDHLQALIIVFFVGSLLILGGLIAAFAVLTESVH